MNTNTKLIMLATMMLLPLSGCLETGTGSQTGYVFAKDCEGVIREVCTVYIKSDAESSAHEEYCLDNESPGYRELDARLERAMDDKSLVRVHYHKELVVSPSRCGPSEILDSVEFL